MTRPIPTYQCHKQVQALKIKAIIPNPRGVELHFEDERFCPIQFDEEWVNRHFPYPGGYVVWYGSDNYANNYVSFSPALAFEAGYTLVDGLAQAPDWSAWPGGPSEVEAALASRDAEIERLRAEAGYTLVDNAPAAMDFGDAIRALKAGKKVARAGWNGKGMWLSLSGPDPYRSIPASAFWSQNNADYAKSTIDGCANVLPCITMKTATGEILMGWLASQSDMLAVDWEVTP